MAIAGGAEVLKHAPPPFHTVLVFISAMVLCPGIMASLSLIDKHATLKAFTAYIQVGPVSLLFLALGIPRWRFDGTYLAITGA